MIGRVATSVVVQDNPLRDVEWATEQNVRRPIASHERYTKTLERVAANDGGLTGKADISPEMGPVGDLWVTWWTPPASVYQWAVQDSNL